MFAAWSVSAFARLVALSLLFLVPLLSGARVFGLTGLESKALSLPSGVPVENPDLALEFIWFVEVFFFLCSLILTLEWFLFFVVKPPPPNF
jgi:hypothetical protein